MITAVGAGSEERSAELYVYGASGHGKVVAEMALAMGLAIAGFIDDGVLSVDKRNLEFPTAGGFDWLADKALHANVAVALGIGDNKVRARIAEKCKRAGISVMTLVHPSAVISPSARIGEGSVVMPMAVVNAEAEIGDGAIINSGAIVEHDCKVGAYAHLSPNAAMGGAARLGALSWLGMGAVLIHQIEVGAGSVIGAGAVVTKDLPDNIVAVGVPARIVR